MTAYYNEFDPKAAAWLRELVAAGHIAPGDVDERDIRDVNPDELRRYDQCHFFAGIGGWSLALRRAGWADTRGVWTGSCPCQPFSAAGKRGGTADERHLWPHWFHLIDQCRPPVVFGEQVASKDGLGWLDLVSADLEGSGYASGAVDLCAAGVGAPHIRQRLWWVAERSEHASGDGRQQWRAEPGGRGAASGRGLGGLADRDDAGPQGGDGEHADPSGREEAARHSGPLRTAGGLADALRNGAGHGPGQGLGAKAATDCGDRGIPGQRLWVGVEGAPGGPGPVNGVWRDADWLYCRDGKWRPVEARAQSLADGLPEGMGRVLDPRAQETEGAIEIYAEIAEARPDEVLRDLCYGLAAEASRERETGGVAGLLPPSLLLAFVCQLAAQGWHLAQGLPLSRPKEPSRGVRLLWDHEAAASASRQRGLDGQPAGEPANLVHLLSPLLARDAQAAWGDAIAADAEIGFPLGTGSPARVARLRGYGNAIVPEAAQAFIEASLEALDDVQRLRLMSDLAGGSSLILPNEEKRNERRTTS